MTTESGVRSTSRLARSSEPATAVQMKQASAVGGLAFSCGSATYASRHGAQSRSIAVPLSVFDKVSAAERKSAGRVAMSLRFAIAVLLALCPAVLAQAPKKDKPTPAKPTSRTTRTIEGWTVRIDDRLLAAPNVELGTKALRFLEGKLADIKVVVPADRLKKLQSVPIVLDLTHGKLGPMQYHPSAGWLKSNGYAEDLAKCVHLPRAADLATKRNINEQPWVILHELAHAYHDQVLGFDEPRIKEAFEKFKKSGRGDKTLLYNGRRVRHYALTNPMEFFAEMTESYFGVNDFFPFNRAELKEAEPEIHELMKHVWEENKKRENR